MNQTKLIDNTVTDRRILRTKKAIRQAFLSLLSDYRIEDITVSQLTELAGINRKTFYLHYKSVRTLYDEIRREQSARISQLSCWKKLSETDPDPYEIFLELNQLIEEDRALYRALFSPTSGIITCQKIKEKILDLDEIRTICRNRPDLEYYIEFTVSGLFSIYLRWLNEPHKLTIEELAKIASELTNNGFGPLKKAVLEDQRCLYRSHDRCFGPLKKAVLEDPKLLPKNPFALPIA